MWIVFPSIQKEKNAPCPFNKESKKIVSCKILFFYDQLAVLVIRQYVGRIRSKTKIDVLY